MDLDGTGETNCFARQALDTGTKCQIVTLNTLRKYLAGQMLLFRKLSGITAPVISGQHTNVKGTE